MASNDAVGLAALMEDAGAPLAGPVLAQRLEGLRREAGVALLATEWGPPSGVIVLHWFTSLLAGRTALVSLLLVAPEARRRGIGRLLVKAGAQAARTAGCTALQGLATSAAPELEAFYRATGFEPMGAALTRSLRKLR